MTGGLDLVWMGQYGIQLIIGGVLIPAFAKLWSEQKALKNGVKAILFNEIKHEYTSCEQKKSAAVADIENAQALYDSYHALGGNGTGTELLKRIKAMPVEEPEKERT